MSVPTPRDPDLIQRSWPASEQPMTRLFERGADALSDAEVLALLLRKGSKDKSAVDLARELLNNAGGISGVLCPCEPTSDALPLEALARLRAAYELVSRALKEKLTAGSMLNSPSAVRDYLRLKLQSLPHEVFIALFVDVRIV